MAIKNFNEVPELYESLMTSVLHHIGKQAQIEIKDLGADSFTIDDNIVIFSIGEEQLEPEAAGASEEFVKLLYDWDERLSIIREYLSVSRDGITMDSFKI